MTVVTFFVILDASGASPVCFVPDRPIDERNRATSQNQGTGTVTYVHKLTARTPVEDEAQAIIVALGARH